MLVLPRQTHSLHSCYWDLSHRSPHSPTLCLTTSFIRILCDLYACIVSLNYTVEESFSSIKFSNHIASSQVTAATCLSSSLAFTMPTTRRSAARTSGPAKGQSTLTFHGKVTKNIVKDLKEPIAKPAVADVTEVKPKEDPADDVVQVDAVPDTVELKDEQPESEEEEEPEVEALPERSEVEIKAEKVTKAQIDKYWKAIEQQRIAPRVHQQDLSLNEKVLRYFDVSSQYGVRTFRSYNQ